MSELELLTAKAAEISSAVDFWNNTVVVFLFAAALVGAAIFVSQRTANMRMKDLATVQDRIAEIKLATLKLRTEELNADNLDMRLVMDMRRHIGGANPASIVSSLSSILEMEDIRVWFQSPSDSEPGVLAAQIRAWVTRARWGGIYDGIFGVNASLVRPGVEVYTPSPDFPLRMLPDTRQIASRSWRAGEAIAEWLRACGINFVEHRMTPPRSRDELMQSPVAGVQGGMIGANSVMILVGPINTEGELEILRKAREERQKTTAK